MARADNDSLTLHRESKTFQILSYPTECMASGQMSNQSEGQASLSFVSSTTMALAGRPLHGLIVSLVAHTGCSGPQRRCATNYGTLAGASDKVTHRLSQLPRE